MGERERGNERKEEIATKWDGPVRFGQKKWISQGAFDSNLHSKKKEHFAAKKECESIEKHTESFLIISFRFADMVSSLSPLSLLSRFYFLIKKEGKENQKIKRLNMKKENNPRGSCWCFGKVFVVDYQTQWDRDLKVWKGQARIKREMTREKVRFIADSANEPSVSESLFRLHLPNIKLTLFFFSVSNFFTTLPQERLCSLVGGFIHSSTISVHR